MGRLENWTLTEDGGGDNDSRRKSRLMRSDSEVLCRGQSRVYQGDLHNRIREKGSALT